MPDTQRENEETHTDPQNPAIRLPVPKDLPAILPHTGFLQGYATEQFRAAIFSYAQNKGHNLNTSPEGTKPVIFVVTPMRVQNDKSAAYNLQDSIEFYHALNTHIPDVKWVLMTEFILGTKNLNRSKNQSSKHALLERQNFIMRGQEYTSTASMPIAFRSPNELFLLSDHCIEQGTTMADLMSFIHHNGGTVLGVSAQKDVSIDRDHLQNTEPTLGPRADMASIMQKCGKADVSALKFFLCLETRLRTHGMSIESLTAQEWTKLSRAILPHKDNQEVLSTIPPTSDFWDIRETLTYAPLGETVPEIDTTDIGTVDNVLRATLHQYPAFV